MIRVSKEFTFDSSHRLNNNSKSKRWNKKIFGKCNNLPSHGHSYKLAITVEGEPNSDTGMVINFVDLKEIVNAVIIEKYDHRFLNDVINGITTCENMAKIIYDALYIPLYNFNGIELYSVILYETATSWATYIRKENKHE